MQRIFLFLATKKTTQSDFIRQLSSYKKNNKTQRAMWEFNNIIRSSFIYEYLDNPDMQKNVQKSLGRIELFHKMCRSIKFTNSGRMRLRTELEQSVWNECSQLVSNCIIHYNSILLSEILKVREEKIKTLEKELRNSKNEKQKLKIQTKIEELQEKITELIPIPLNN